MFKTPQKHQFNVFVLINVFPIALSQKNKVTVTFRKYSENDQIFFEVHKIFT